MSDLEFECECWKKNCPHVLRVLELPKGIGLQLLKQKDEEDPLSFYLTKYTCAKLIKNLQELREKIK